MTIKSQKLLCIFILMVLSSAYLIRQSATNRGEVAIEQGVSPVSIELHSPGLILKYAVRESEIAPKLAQELTKKSEVYEQREVAFYGAFREKLNHRMKTADKMGSIKGKEVHWAEKNSDASLAVVSFENPMISTAVVLSVFRLDDGLSLLELKSNERLCDVMWSPFAARKLMVLSSTDSLSWANLNPFVLLGGHPKSDTVFTLRVYDLDTSKVLEHQLGESLINADGGFVTD